VPTSLFKSIVDLEIVMNECGEPRNNKNEEVRSRFLAPVCTSVRHVKILKLYETIVESDEDLPLSQTR